MKKRHQKYDTFFYQFFIDFGPVLGPKLGPCWGYVGHKPSKKRLRKQHKKDTKNRRPRDTPGQPGNEILGALNNTENNPAKATIPENTPSQLALWRIWIYPVRKTPRDQQNWSERGAREN